MFNQIWSARAKEKGVMPQIITLSKARVRQNLSNKRKATSPFLNYVLRPLSCSRRP